MEFKGLKGGNMKEYKNDYQAIKPLENQSYQDYINLILSSRENIRQKEYYQEKHHIVPKCLGGTNDKNNLVWLFGEEHYWAHMLLAKENPHEKKLIYPWWRMSNDGLRTVSPEEYKEAKQTFIQSRKGIPLSEETKKKLSDNAKERFAKGEHPWVGKHHSEETKKKIKEHHADISGDKNYNYGKHLSEEAKQKISEANKGNQHWLGKHHTEETKQKLSKANKGRKVTEETKQKMRGRTGAKSIHHKAIKCIETRIIYSCVKEAAEQTHNHPSSLAQCARGETKICRRYHWEYIKEENKNESNNLESRGS